MYPVSAAYKTAIGQNVRDIKITGTITLKDDTIINITDEDIVQGSLYVTEQCVAGEDIEVGNVYASEMGLSLSMPLENPYSLDGARILLHFGIDVGGLWETVPLGYFYVTDIARKARNVNLTALDGMLLFDVEVGDPGSSSPRNFIVHACQRAGVTLGTSIGEIDALPNAGVLLAAPDASKIKTARDLLMWACQITGSFARMNRQGQVEIVPIKAKPSVKTIAKNERFNSDVSDFAIKITKVSMQVGETVYSRGTDGMTMILEENPLMTGLSESQINQILDYLLAQITQAVYVPFNSNFIGDPALQPGDFVTLADTSVLGGGDVASIITHSTWRYRGPHNIKGAGKHGLVRGVQNQQIKAVSSIVAIARAAQDLALSANQSTQLIKDAIGGHVLIRQSPDETNEILIMDHPDPDQATKIWRWNMGGLGYSDNCVGADNPAREYDIAMTMDGAINANFIKTGQLDAGVVRIGPETTFAPGYDPTQISSASMGVDSNCTALFHFDGSLNSHKGLSPTFTRASPAYLSDGTQVEAGQPRFEPGEFGRGVLVEEGTMNLCPNSSLEDNFDGWFSSGYQCTVERDNTYARFGLWSAKITTGIPGSNFYAAIGGEQFVPVSANTQYTVSSYVRPYLGHQISVRLDVVFWKADKSFNGEVIASGESAYGSGVWERLSGTFVTPANTAFVEIRLRGTEYTGDGAVCHLDGVQLELGAVATSFVEGTREPEGLQIPTAGVFEKGKWAIAFNFIPTSDQAKDYNGLWEIYIDANNRYLLGTEPNGLLYAQVVSGGVLTQIIDDTVLQVGSNYNVVLAGDGTTLSMYVNGELISAISYTEPVGTLPTNMALGSTWAGTYFANGVFDEVVFFNYAPTAEEIAGWYKANAPFYTSEDMKQWPGYLKAETDGIKVYDSNDALRVLLGSWLKGAIRKYGLKIIGGEIYSTMIQTGEEGDDSYVYIGPVHEKYDYPFMIKLDGKDVFNIMSHSRGPIMNFYDPYYNERVATILPMDDARGQGLRIQALNNIGEALDLHLDGREVTISTNGSFYVPARGTVAITSRYSVLIGAEYNIVLDGDTAVVGDLTKTGTLNYVEPTKDYGIRLLNALEGPELKYVDMGRAQLENGEATVYLDPILLQCIEPDTDLTPWLFKTEVYGEGEDIRVIEWGENYFRVKECNNGTSNRKFGWWFYATRINYAGIRLQEYVGVV